MYVFRWISLVDILEYTVETYIDEVFKVFPTP